MGDGMHCRTALKFCRACTVRATGIERGGGRTRANKGDFVTREKESIGVEEEVGKSVKLRFSYHYVCLYPDSGCRKVRSLNPDGGFCYLIRILSVYPSGRPQHYSE